MSYPFSPRLIPTVAIVLGVLFIIVSAALAISHFWYGAPVIDRRSREPVSDGAVAFYVSLFGIAGCVVAWLGIRALGATIRRSNDQVD